MSSYQPPVRGTVCIPWARREQSHWQGLVRSKIGHEPASEIAILHQAPLDGEGRLKLSPRLSFVNLAENSKAVALIHAEP
jgi:hypothetical protein